MLTPSKVPLLPSVIAFSVDTTADSILDNTLETIVSLSIPAAPESLSFIETVTKSVPKITAFSDPEATDNSILKVSVLSAVLSSLTSKLMTAVF